MCVRKSARRRRGVEVSTSVAQRLDGTINRGSEKGDPPLVHVHTTGAVGLTTEQARELIGMLIEAVNELDAWTR